MFSNLFYTWLNVVKVGQLQWHSLYDNVNEFNGHFVATHPSYFNELRLRLISYHLCIADTLLLTSHLLRVF